MNKDNPAPENQEDKTIEEIKDYMTDLDKYFSGQDNPAPVQSAEEILHKYWNKNNYMQAYFIDQKAAILSAMEEYAAQQHPIQSAKAAFLAAREKVYPNNVAPHEINSVWKIYKYADFEEYALRYKQQKVSMVNIDDRPENRK